MGRDETDRKVKSNGILPEKATIYYIRIQGERVVDEDEAGAR